MACTNSFGASAKSAQNLKNNNHPYKRNCNGTTAATADATTPINTATSVVGAVAHIENSIATQEVDSTDNHNNHKTLDAKAEPRPENSIAEEVEPDYPNKKCGEETKSSKPEAAAAMAAAKEATDRGDMTGMCPPSRLSHFYDFFSLSHIPSPILCKWNIKFANGFFAGLGFV